MSQAGLISISSSVLPPEVPLQFTTDSGVAVPAANNLNVFGVVNPAGTDPFSTSGATDTVTINIQTSQAVAASDATKIGLSNYNSAQFTVDPNGFVSFTGTGAMQTLTGNSGVATPVANNINVITANSTVKFVGSGSTLTQDFGLANLVLGSSLPSLAGGNFNVGLGLNALSAVTSGSSNTGIGTSVLTVLTTGSSNTVIGSASMTNATSANSNCVIGVSAASALLTGSRNFIAGINAGDGYTGAESDNILIINQGTTGESHTIRIGTQGTGSNQQAQCYLAGVLNTVSGRVVKITSPGAYPYTTLTTDYVILVDTSAARTITPLAAPVTGTTYRIKDSVGSAAANNITITPSGKNIDGAASYVINNNYGSVDIVYNGTEWNRL